jgi:hypothetical protein
MLTEIHRLKVFETRMIRTIYGKKIDGRTELQMSQGGLDRQGMYHALGSTGMYARIEWEWQ